MNAGVVQETNMNYPYSSLNTIITKCMWHHVFSIIYICGTTSDKHMH